MAITKHNVQYAKIWPSQKCVHCGRSHPEAVLNFEGYMHHGTPYECIDRKACNKARKKKK